MTTCPQCGAVTGFNCTTHLGYPTGQHRNRPVDPAPIDRTQPRKAHA